MFLFLFCRICPSRHAVRGTTVLHLRWAASPTLHARVLALLLLAMHLRLGTAIEDMCHLSPGKKINRSHTHTYTHTHTHSHTHTHTPTENNTPDTDTHTHTTRTTPQTPKWTPPTNEPKLRSKTLQLNSCVATGAAPIANAKIKLLLLAVHLRLGTAVEDVCYLSSGKFKLWISRQPLALNPNLKLHLSLATGVAPTKRWNVTKR